MLFLFCDQLCIQAKAIQKILDYYELWRGTKKIRNKMNSILYNIHPHSKVVL